jgi:DNA-binding GntR family transcriptional regulator
MADDVFQTAPEIAYEIISQKILDGEFPPGMKLSRRKMAEVANVSVIPVIEALKKLEENGLVESKPKWGSFVTVPTRAKIIQSYQVREAIECEVARIMSRQMSDEQAAKLQVIATELDTVPYQESTILDSRKNHMQFHRDLAQYTGNSMLVANLDKINLFWILCQALGANASKKSYPRYWHRKLLDDIKSGDPDRAEKSMREHVYDSLDPILEALNEK